MSTSPWDMPGIAAATDKFWAANPLDAEHRRQVGSIITAANPVRTTVLDVGCGTGRFYPVLVPSLIASDQYTGIDSSTEMLAIAQRRYPGVRWLSGDVMERLPFEDQSVAFVLCCAVLGHLPELERPLRELWRVARSALLFTIWVTKAPTPEETMDGTVRKVVYPAAMIWNLVGRITDHQAQVRAFAVDRVGSWAWLVQR